MSVYPEDELTASVYHPDDSDSTKKTSYPASADFTIFMNIIRRNEADIAIMGQESGEYVANVNGTYANAANIKKGDKITCNSIDYIVTNKPRKNVLFNAYKVLMRNV